MLLMADQRIATPGNLLTIGLHLHVAKAISMTLAEKYGTTERDIPDGAFEQ